MKRYCQREENGAVPSGLNPLSSPDEVNNHILEADKKLGEKEQLLALQQSELEKVLKDMDNVYSLMNEGHISREAFGKRNRVLEERQKALEDDIPRLQAEVDVAKIEQLSSTEIMSEVQDLETHWPELNSSEKRTIVEAITQRIVVTKESVSIRLHYFPTKDAAKGWRKGRDLNPR